MTKESLMTQMQELTGLENPNSVVQMKDWLAGNGIETDSLDKKAIRDLLPDATEHVSEVLACRQQMAKSSVSKYRAMALAVCADGRARGMFQFYGAPRSGRWCLTGDHEVLTRNGWVRLDEWTGGTIACWSPNGEIVSFKYATALHFPYSGIMYKYTDEYIDQCSTPEHTMCVKMAGEAVWRNMEVTNLADLTVRIPVAENHGSIHDLSLHTLNFTPVLLEYTGDVFCAETTTGYFLVRRNGRIWVTGNSGKHIQLQNLPQNHMEDLDEARALVRDGNFDALQMLYDNIPNVLSELIRTAFIPKQGYKFIVADFSAIEARVLSFLAGEKWRMDIF